MRKLEADKPLKAKKKPMKKLENPGDQNFGRLSREERITTIYIGNLNYKKDEFALKKLFAKYGKVTYVRLVRDQKTNNSKGFAFIQMPNHQDALVAIKKLNHSSLDGRTLKVSIAVENDTIIKTSNGVPVRGEAPEVYNEKKATEPKEVKELAKVQIQKRRNRARGLDLLFKNTRS